MATHGYTLKEKKRKRKEKERKLLSVFHLMKPSSVMEESVQRGFKMVNYV